MLIPFFLNFDQKILKDNKKKGTSCHIFLGQDGFIYNIYYGDQTGTSIKIAGKQVFKIVKQLKLKDKRVLILADVSKIGEINLLARQAGLDLIKELEYEKLAIYGADFVTSAIVKLVVSASGRSFKIKSFDNLKEAKKWLKS